MTAPRIFELKHNALDDGPGIRSVVFFKGCPLACAWCHNPEGMRAEVELAFDAEKCVACDSCLEICAEQALDRALSGYIDRERCTLCFDCVAECPSGALAQVGDDVDVEAVVAAVLANKVFFDNSGGGVTLSGGEPTLHMETAAAIAQRLHAEGVHVLLETCGQFRLERFEQLLYPHLDLIYFDLKLVDAVAHRRHCGVDNQTILDNFTALHERARAGGVELLPRVPLVPGLTATDANLAEIAALLARCGAERVALLAYNPLWGEKLGRLGRPGVPADIETADRWMPDAELQRCRDHFEAFEVLGP